MAPMATGDASKTASAPAAKRRKTSAKKAEDTVSYVLQKGLNLVGWFWQTVRVGQLLIIFATLEISTDDVIDSHELAANTEIHSSTKAKLMFEWLIYPMPLEDFYQKYWEKRPLVIKRKLPTYYEGW